MSQQSITVRQEGEHVHVIYNGKLVLDIPYSIAGNLAHMLNSKAKQAEEYAKAEQIIADHALLMRSGAPFGLSDNPKIQDAAATVAAHDRDLRRFMPGGVKSQEHLGVPSVRVVNQKGVSP